MKVIIHLAVGWLHCKLNYFHNSIFFYSKLLMTRIHVYCSSCIFHLWWLIHIVVHCSWNPSYLPAVTQLTDWYIVRKLLCQEINITCSHRLQVCRMFWIDITWKNIVILIMHTPLLDLPIRVTIHNTGYIIHSTLYRCNPQVNSPSDVCSNSYYLYLPRTKCFLLRLTVKQ